MTLHFGDYTNPPVRDLFNFVQIDANTFEFYRDYYVVGQEDSPFRITRRYEFAPDEYMFRTEVQLANSTNAPIPLNFNDVAYTIAWGPQIGPRFEQLDQRIEFRRYMVLDDGDREIFRRVGTNNPEIVQDRVTWAAVAGKYFGVVAIPEIPNFTTVLAQEPREGLPVGSQLYISRPPVRASLNEDAFYFYVGPKTPAVLDNYQNAQDNAWGRSDLELREIQESRLLFGWLENILKAVLNFIVRFVPNYGVSIIILTVMVKLLLYPLTRKSYESNARMQAVQPKMQELREKYKDNQQKVNEEMAKLYKKEGVNPLGGCLPMLAQFPFFIAMYGLFNNHFDLRGATFIPGWITDLSAPDVIVSFGDFTLPLIGWTALRGLPIIFVATQLLSTKLTQTTSTASSSGQMKFMQLGLPIIFFFILYNVPSGLLVYWIFSNLLTVVQQYYYNNIRKKDPPKDTKSKKGKKRP
jgi:YidC/Oxa1 family membrane protein insertase